MEIEMIPVDKIKPYKRNAKEHPEWQVEQIMQSIQQYGDNDPVAVWGRENVVVEGHGRLEALKRLGYSEIPCIRLDHLSDKERREYALVHNKLTADTDFDFDILADELDGLDFGDLELDWGFDDAELEQLEHEQYAEETQYRKANILGLEKRQFDGVGPYDIPPIKPVSVEQVGEIREWIRFSDVLTDKDPEGKAVHFFIDDYKFERIFSNPDKYIEKLLRYLAILSPDFSPYCDMPMATQIFNHYRKHWVGAYLQEAGVTVIPTIRASTDPRSLEWYLDGEPEGGVVCISSMYTREKEARDFYINEHNRMVETLKPEKVFVYGKVIDGTKGNIERIETFAEK